MSNATTPVSAVPLTTSGRYLILIVGFLGWFCAGLHMSITQLTGQPAAIDLLDRAGELDAARYLSLNKQAQKKITLSDADKAQMDVWKPLVARWFTWLQCAFLFGAATGGLVFGWLGDRIGRSKAMAASILTYSSLAGAASFAQSPAMLCALWYLACMGVGGMWPNGVALVSEAWSGMSRPAVAGIIGTSANIGIFLMSALASKYEINSEKWRWAFQVGAGAVVLGVVAWFAVPESPRWLAARGSASVGASSSVPSTGVFQHPLLAVTIIAIVLATVPMIGGWGTANWMNPWSEDVRGSAFKATVLKWRSLTGLVGSLLGGWIASMLGRRQTYFVVSLLSLCLAQYIFVFLSPEDDSFLIWVSCLGFVSGVYFGWLPLCLPEMFPTRVRSTGAGVGFNFGRIATAVTLFATGAMMQLFQGNYPRIGRITSLLFILGMVAIWLAPDTSKKQLED